MEIEISRFSRKTCKMFRNFRILSKKIGLLYVGGLQSPFSQIKYAKHLKDLDNKIIECKYENSQWIFMRERTDKSYPNSYNTAMGKKYIACKNATCF